MLGPVIIIALAVSSLVLCGTSLMRLKLRASKYDFQESAQTLMWRFLSVKHFALIYTVLVVFWAILSLILGLRLILN